MRSRYGVSVLAVKRRTREGLERRFVPAPDDRFQTGDVLIVLGTEDAIERLKESPRRIGSSVSLNHRFIERKCFLPGQSTDEPMDQ